MQLLNYIANYKIVKICKRKQTADTCKFVPHHRSISEIDVRIYYEMFKNDPNHAKQRRPLGLVKY